MQRNKRTESGVMEARNSVMAPRGETARRVAVEPRRQRSLLVSSALDMERFLRAQTCDADVHLIDLEDSVPQALKADARARFRQLDPNRVQCRTLGVRINGLHTREGLEDLVALLDSPIEPDLIVVPKIETVNDIELIDDILTRHRLGSTLWALIETVRGVANAAAIAAARPRMSALTFGAADFSSQIGATLASASVDQARIAVVIAARGAGIDAVDAPTFDLEDGSQLREDCRRSSDMGYTGKVAIHPRQIPVINECYTPSSRMIEWAQEVLEQPENAAGHLGVVGGSMIGPPFRRRAQNILQQAGASVPERAAGAAREA